MKKILTLLNKNRSQYANPTKARVSIPEAIQEKIFSCFSIANGLTVKRLDDNKLDNLSTFMVGDYRFRWSWPANNVPAVISLDTNPRNVTAWIIQTSYRPVLEGNAVFLFASEKIAQDYIKAEAIKLGYELTWTPVPVQVTGQDALLGKVAYEYACYILPKK